MARSGITRRVGCGRIAISRRHTGERGQRYPRGRDRLTASRGAALVEYALALALLVAGAIGVIHSLEDGASAEVDNQADCLSTRPPPTTCAPADLTPTTTTPPSGNGNGGGGGNNGNGGNNNGNGNGGGVNAAGNDSNGNAPTMGGVALGPNATAQTVGANGLQVGATLQLTDDTGQPIEGMTGTIQWTVTAPPARAGSTGYTDCVSDATGQCDFTVDTTADVTRVTVRLISIADNGQPLPLPDNCTVCGGVDLTVS